MAGLRLRARIGYANSQNGWEWVKCGGTDSGDADDTMDGRSWLDPPLAQAGRFAAYYLVLGSLYSPMNGSMNRGHLNLVEMMASLPTVSVWSGHIRRQILLPPRFRPMEGGIHSLKRRASRTSHINVL